MDTRNHLLNRVSLAVIALLWVAMVTTLLFNSSSPTKTLPQSESIGTFDENKAEIAGLGASVLDTFISLKQQHHQTPHANRPSRVRATLTLPKRYTPATHIEPPPPLEEIRANMTVYLHELHSKLEALAGPRVSALTVWETFLDVTKKMPMVSFAFNPFSNAFDSLRAVSCVFKLMR